MKKIFLIACFGIGLFWSTNVRGQAQEIEQLVLDIQKLSQFKQILSDMKEGYQILTAGYNAVRDISEGNFNLHKAFLDALLAVSPTVKTYFKVARIIENQIKLVGEYKSAYSQFQSSGQFNPDELAYVMSVYNNLITASLTSITDLSTVLTAGSLRMSDAERLAAIDRLDQDMTGKLNFLRSFNNRTAVLGLQRAKEQENIEQIQKMYNAIP
jgi:DNA repair ATPase RecN